MTQKNRTPPPPSHSIRATFTVTRPQRQHRSVTPPLRPEWTNPTLCITMECPQTNTTLGPVRWSGEGRTNFHTKVNDKTAIPETLGKCRTAFKALGVLVFFLGLASAGLDLWERTASFRDGVKRSRKFRGRRRLAGWHSLGPGFKKVFPGPRAILRKTWHVDRQVA